VRRVPRSRRFVAASAIVLAFVVGATVILRTAYTYCPGGRVLSAVFPSAGEGLLTGAEVDYRGVQVGRVQSVQLVRSGEADLRIKLEKGFRVPANARATLRPRSLFGNEYVALDFPSGQEPPYLGPGQAITSTGVAPSLTNLIATSVPLFRSIHTGDLETVLTSLTAALRGEGTRIAASLTDNSHLSGLLANTIEAQLAALSALDQFNRAVNMEGPTFNAISRNLNQALPPIDASEGAFQHMLESFQPLLTDLTQLIEDYRPSIDTLLTKGADVSRVLIANAANVQEMVYGEYRYAYKFAGAISPGQLPDGSRMFYFKVFIVLKQVNDLVCGLLSPLAASPQGAGLASALRQAASQGTGLDCSAYLSALRQAQGSRHGSSTAAPAGAAAPSPASAPAASPPSPRQVLKRLARRVWGQVGKPERSLPEGNALQTVLGNVLGGVGG